MDFLNLAHSNAPYSEKLKEAAARIIDSGRFLNGPETEALEAEIAAVTGAEYCIAVSNGLDAIRLIFRAYMEQGRLTPGDEVIFPANTFIASVLPITELGLNAVAAPVDPLTHNLDWSRLQDFIGEKTKAILLVHLYGSPCWDASICRMLHDQGLLIIEDNAQALGAMAAEEGFGGSRYCGALGDAAAVSFYPTKNLGALGDAGMVLTSDKRLANDVRTLAQYGSDRRYHNIYQGYNNRMDELQAAFLRVKLPYLDDENDRRRQAAQVYCEEISHPEVKTPAILPGTRQVWHQYVVTSARRDQLKDWLAQNGIPTDIHYPIPPHAQPCYEGTFSHPSLNESRRLADSILSLPIANISPEKAKEISRIINLFPIQDS
ncbi:MAG: DegT/DnrJ/EryC1/StrS family aminotransferase [Muribaculaceae bacterium]|nr:DegT/DnrJ/EryC1/StrS family aminotransferase [Muribaculaceae bacterium]